MKKKRNSRAIFIFPVYIVVTGSVVFYIVLYMGFLTVSQIEVKGNKRVSQREILKRSGLIKGKSTLLFLEDRVRREILESHWIKEVRLERVFPGKVVIEVEEKEPFCLALSEEGELLYVDKNGKRLGRANFKDGLDFPLLIGEGIDEPELLGEAIELLNLSLKSRVLGWDEISEVNLDPLYGITVFTNDKRRIDFGEGDVAKKWYRVEQLIVKIRQMNLIEEYINVSSDKMGVVSFKF